MGPCTTAWFHSDWSSKVGPTLLTNLPSLVTAPQATLSQPVQHSLDKLCSWPSLGTQRSVEKKKKSTFTPVILVLGRLGQPGLLSEFQVI